MSTSHLERCLAQFPEMKFQPPEIHAGGPANPYREFYIAGIVAQLQRRLKQQGRGGLQALCLEQLARAARPELEPASAGISFQLAEYADAIMSARNADTRPSDELTYLPAGMDSATKKIADLAVKTPIERREADASAG